MSRIAAVTAIILLATACLSVQGQSRLEADYENQLGEMRVLLRATDEPSCGGTWLKVWLVGHEIRKMDWAIETSQGHIDREFYFSRGKPQLVIETGYRNYDNSGKKLYQPKQEYIHRYWLHDRSAGPKGIRVRRTLRKHADSLTKYFSNHKAKFG